MGEDSSGEGKNKALHFDIPEEFHRRLKMLSAMKGVTLKSYAVQALKEKVERDEKDLNPKREV